MKLFTLGITGTCSNNRGYSGALPSPTALKTNYRSKIGSLLVLMIFALGFFLIPSSLFSQTPPLPDEKSCVSKDLLVVEATLLIEECFTCEEGETVNLPLVLSINNKTGSFRPTFAFFGTLEVTDADGNVTTSLISGCDDTEGLPPMEITEVTFQTIAYTCGTTLKLTDVFLAWTDASKPIDNKGNYDPTHPNSCPKLTTKVDSKGILDITPKCGTDDVIVINTPINVTIDEPIIICEGETVTLTADATGGDGAYTYLWSTGETTPSIEVSPTETTDYTVTVSAPSIFDPNVQCSDSYTATVTVNPANDAGDDGELTVCSDDVTDYSLFDELGGTPQAGGTWTAPGGGDFDGSFNASTDAAGTYIYTVDADGEGPCPEDSADVVVTINPANDAGNDGELTVCSDDVTDHSLFDELGGTPQTGGTWTAAGGGDFDGTFNASVDAAGTYIYTVDADGEGPCAEDSADVVVTINPANDAGDDGELTVCSDDVTDYSLFDELGGTPQAGGTWTAPGGGDFDGSFNASTDAAGTYIYTVDADGEGPCPEDSADVVVTINPANYAGEDGDLTVCESDDSDHSLFDELGGTPQSGGSWTAPGGGDFDGSFNASSDTAGTYTYTVDADGTDGPCAADSAVVELTITPANDAGDDGELTVCSDDVTDYSLFDELGGTPQAGGTWTAPGGGDFDGSFNASTDAAGTYIYTVDADGEGPCPEDSADVVVTINPLPPLTIQIAPNDCFSDPINPGKFVVTSTTTGLKFSLDGGTFVVYTGEYTGLAPGSHSIKAKDDITGCESLLLFNIDQPFSSPVSPILSAVQPDCATLKGTISVTNVVAGQTYAIKLKSDLSDPVYASYPTNGFENLDPGVYVVLVKSADGCSGSGAEITLIEPNCVTGEGCTLGYWKNHTTKWCSTYTTCTLYSSVFTPSAEFSLIYPNLTLLQALNLMGNTDGENLARQSVAALLNACSSSVGYDLTEAQVIAQTNAAWLSGGSNINTVATALDVLNNQLCTLGGPRSTKPTPICVAAKGKPVSKVANTVAKGSGNVTLDSNSNAKQFRASPVPFRETLSIEYDFDYSSAAKIQLFDLQGRLLRTYNEANAFKGKVTELSIDFRTRASQVYVIKITTDRDVFTKKIISDK